MGARDVNGTFVVKLKGAHLETKSSFLFIGKFWGPPGGKLGFPPLRIIPKNSRAINLLIALK